MRGIIRGPGTRHLSVARPNIAALEAESLEAIERGAHASPFTILGVQGGAGRRMLRVNAPGAWRVEARARGDRSLLAVLDQSRTPGLFAAPYDADAPYVLRVYWPGRVDEHEDPYSFPPAIAEADLRAICETPMRGASDVLGAHPAVLDGVPGVRFALWAPQAASVAVAGDFNEWSDRRHPMGRRAEAGVWELFVPRIGAGARYYFAVRAHENAEAVATLDPFAREIEYEPHPAGIVATAPRHHWRDERYLAIRRARRDCAPPVSIYRIEPDVWLGQDGRIADWRTLAERLPAFVDALGFTHVQIGMARRAAPAWMFATPPELGATHDFAAFVDACHEAGLGVIVEWDAPERFRPIIGDETLLENILVDSALYWLDAFHIDGLSVKAEAGAGRLLARLRGEVERHAQGALLIAETADGAEHAGACAWRPEAVICALEGDAAALRQESAAGLEGALLPITPHTLARFERANCEDELALLRALYAFAWLAPGIKLMQMGAELGQHQWPGGGVNWDVLDDPRAIGFLKLIRDLNSTLRNEAPIRLSTRVSQLLTWLQTEAPVIAYVRSGEAAAALLVAMNRGGEARTVRLETSCGGSWRELLNTDSRHYGGGDVGNFGSASALPHPSLPGQFQLDITLPPRGAIIFRKDD